VWQASRAPRHVVDIHSTGRGRALRILSPSPHTAPSLLTPHLSGAGHPQVPGRAGDHPAASGRLLLLPGGQQGHGGGSPLQEAAPRQGLHQGARQEQVSGARLGGVQVLWGAGAGSTLAVRCGQSVVPQSVVEELHAWRWGRWAAFPAVHALA
jgi:hypothetical protein